MRLDCWVDGVSQQIVFERQSGFAVCGHCTAAASFLLLVVVEHINVGADLTVQRESVAVKRGYRRASIDEVKSGILAGPIAGMAVIVDLVDVIRLCSGNSCRQTDDRYRQRGETQPT